MNARAKGKRNEHKIRVMLEAEGWEVEIMPSSKFGHQDFFNRWDLVAVREGSTRWIQSKTNRLPPPAYRKFLASFQGAGSREIWVFYDRKKEPRIIYL